MIVGFLSIISVATSIGCFILGARMGFEMGKSGKWVTREEKKEIPKWLADNRPKGGVHIMHQKSPDQVRRDREAIKNNIPSFVRRKGNRYESRKDIPRQTYRERSRRGSPPPKGDEDYRRQDMEN